MDETTTTSLPKIRTYARDLTAERKKRGIAAPTDSSGEPSPAPTLQAAAPKSRPAVARIPTPTPVVAQTEVTVIPPLAASPALTPTPTPTRTPNEREPQPVPPFHALNKRERPAVSNVTAYGQGIGIQNDESGATIITDTKADRFKVAPSIFNSLKNWCLKTFRALTEKKPPKYVLPETDRRKGIIQRATSQTGKVVANDSAQLREQVMRRNDAEPTPEPHEPTTTWTPNTEPIFQLIEAPDEPVQHVTNVRVSLRQEDTTPAVATMPAVAVPPPPAPPVATPPPAPEPMTPPPPLEAVLPPLPPEPTEEPEEVVSVLPPTPPPQEAAPQTIRTQTQSYRLLSTNTIAVVVVGGVLVAFLAISGRQYLTTQTPPPPAPPQYSGVVLRTPTTYLELPERTRSGVFTTLANQPIASGTPAVEIILTSENTPLTGATLLTLIAPKIDQNFAQSVTTIIFGKHAGTEPFILLRVSDRTSTLGGLLKWEATMSADLEPFFAQNPDVAGRAFFDRRITSYDVRLLSDRAGNEHIVYGFIDAQTILITSDHLTLLSLAALATPED